CIDVEPDLSRLRRRKDADELALLRRAIAAGGAMVARARKVVGPGVSELEVFSVLQAAAVEACGEMLTATGNDYACGVRGGPPRVRACLAGELYILDLGPAYRGYFADISRTLAVDRHPTAEQLSACERVCGGLALVERIARPGVSCRSIYEEVREWLGGAAVGTWSSHLGHGIGLSVHKTPRLNPHWDDVLEEGDVILSVAGWQSWQLSQLSLLPYLDSVPGTLSVEHARFRRCRQGIERDLPAAVRVGCGFLDLAGETDAHLLPGQRRSPHVDRLLPLQHHRVGKWRTQRKAGQRHRAEHDLVDHDVAPAAGAGIFDHEAAGLAGKFADVGCHPHHRATDYQMDVRRLGLTPRTLAAAEEEGEHRLTDHELRACEPACSAVTAGDV
ncbi:MAG: M24 family metallopeptidase, partial [Pirellulales bacterium]